MKTNILEKHAECQQKLLEILVRAEKMFDKVYKEKTPEVSLLKKKVLDHSLHVVVLGSFKRGKSTLINALLGERILPDFATPCTAVN